jgi:two-component system, LytTR family, response regulator
MNEARSLSLAGARVEIEEVARNCQSMTLKVSWNEDGDGPTGEAIASSLRDAVARLGEDRASAPQRFRERLTVRSTGRVGFLKTADIEWIDAAHNYVRIHTLDGKTHVAREPIGELETRLDGERFLRIHRSTIINAECVRELEVSPHGNYVAILVSGQRLSISRSFKDRLPLLLGT